MVPGFVDPEPFEDRILALPVILTVEDEDLHRGHFAARAQEDASLRPFQRYLRGFRNIRKVQGYIREQAAAHGVPVIANESLDRTLSSLLDLVVERATERLRRRGELDGVNALEEARR
jgi:2-phosphoglycerate kinase